MNTSSGLCSWLQFATLLVGPGTRLLDGLEGHERSAARACPGTFWLPRAYRPRAHGHEDRRAPGPARQLPGRKDRHEILQLLDDPTTASAPTLIALASARSPPRWERSSTRRSRSSSASWDRGQGTTLGYGNPRRAGRGCSTTPLSGGYFENRAGHLTGAWIWTSRPNVGTARHRGFVTWYFVCSHGRLR